MNISTEVPALPVDTALDKRRAAAPIVGMALFILAEAMFFAAIVSAYLVTSTQTEAWPPPEMPTLPIGISAFNAVVLLASGLFVAIAEKTRKRGKENRHREFLTVGLVSGLCFLLFQGSEWVRMIGNGMNFASGTYASFFYLIVGIHGLHVCCALAYLGFIFVRGQKEDIDHEIFKAACMLWYFVVALWPILYALVYLYPGVV